MVRSTMLCFAYREQVNELARETFMQGMGAVMSVGLM